MTKHSNSTNIKIASGVIVLFHCIGAVGIKLYPQLFLQKSLYNLVLSAFLVFLFSGLKQKDFFILTGLAGVSFLIEVIGVKTEIPFGSYWYGIYLGPKLFNVPLIIGINWIMLLYCCNVIFRKQPFFIGAVGSAALMVLLDYIMEQNVEKLGFWFWKDSIIPFQNYVAWFSISLLFSIIIKKYIEIKSNGAAITLYLTQLVFFLYCYILIK